MPLVTAEVCATILALLASRPPDGSVCPSEVARALSPGGGWRSMMPTVHMAVDRLVEGGSVRLSWKGQPLPARVGPYRIRLADGDPRPAAPRKPPSAG